ARIIPSTCWRKPGWTCRRPSLSAKPSVSLKGSWTRWRSWRSSTCDHLEKPSGETPGGACRLSRSERGGELQRAAEELRDKLGRFASRPRFNREFETAFDFYFGHGLGEFGPLDEADFERFMEWFVYDYPLSNGHRLIELFDLEKRSDLSAGGRRLLRQWLHAHLSLLELVDGTGDLWQMTDLLTGKRLEGVRVPMKTPIRWSLVIGRPLAMGRGYELSANYLVLPPSIKETFIEHLR